MNLPPFVVPSLVALLGLLSAAAATAAPVTFALHGHLSGSAGVPVADGKYAVAARIYEASDAKVPLFEELFLSVPVGSGLFALHLGDNPKVALDHATLVGKDLWFGLTIGDDPELPRQRLRPVPAAVQAHVAFDLQCSGCVTAARLAASSVQAKHIDFGYAASDSKGGPANHALTADKAKLAEKADAADTAKDADTAKKADFAAKADEAQSALVAAKLQCTGCIKTDMLDAAVLAPYALDAKLAAVAKSGKYGDLTDKPDLAAYGKLADGNTWLADTTFAKNAVVKGGLSVTGTFTAGSVKMGASVEQNGMHTLVIAGDSTTGTAFFHIVQHQQGNQFLQIKAWLTHCGGGCHTGYRNWTSSLNGYCDVQNHEDTDQNVNTGGAWVIQRQVTGKEPSNNLDTCNRIKIAHNAGGVNYGGPYRIVITSNTPLTLIQ